MPTASAAVTFTVNTTADTVDANLADGLCLDAGGNCSLRAAVQQANATAGADIINIPAGTYTLTRVGSDNTSINGDLDITDDLTINGAGQATTIIQAGPTTATGIDRVIQINPNSNRTLTINISDVTIKNGKIAATGGAGIQFDGFNGTPVGILNLTNCTISDNETGARGAGIRSFDGTVNITGCTISGNKTTNATGGGIDHRGAKPITIINSTITNNTAEDTLGISNSPNGRGGGLFFLQTTGGTTPYSIQNSTISNNKAEVKAGGIFMQAPTTMSNNCIVSGNSVGLTGSPVAPALANGGGIYSDLDPNTAGLAFDNILDGVVIKGNTATGGGGGIFHDRDGLIVKNSDIGGATAVDKNLAFNGGGLATYLDIGGVGQTGTVSIQNTTIRTNTATDNGGGLFNSGRTVEIKTNSVVGGPAGQGNTAAKGGGIANNSGTLTMLGGEVKGNIATGNGGGFSSTGGSTTFDNSLINSNAATGNGGGIYNNGGTVMLINDSAVGNPGNTAANGGGIANNLGTLTMTSGAIMGNQAAVNGGGVYASGGTINMAPALPTVISIINNTAGNGGGAVATSGGTMTLSKSNIKGNSATGDGGGGLLHGGGSLTVNLSRIFGNSASDASSTGLKSSAGTLDATNNWWGCNIDPTITGNGCDTVSGTTNHNPRLVLNHTASPAQIPVNGTSTLTAHFLTNSAGGSIAGVDLIALGGLPVSFHNAVLGTISNADPLINNGQATATYTAGGVGGNGSADATVDNGTATAHITIEEAPSISCPANVTVNAAAGQNTAVVTYASPTTTGFPAPTVTCSPPSGSTFNSGTTTVQCTATNGVSPDATCSFTVTVITNQAPVANAGADQTIECSGPNTPVTLNGSASTDPDGDTLTFAWSEGANSLGSGAVLNTSLSAGSHTITLIVTDPGGASDTDTVVINIVDTQAPTITVNGANPMTVECHTSFTDPGATASDGCAGSVAVTSSGSVDTDTPGPYTITYTATDGTNTATATRTVNVVDTQAPTITVNGANPMTVECHTSFTDPGATASDACAGSVAVTSSGSVDTDTPGTYTITYNASDPSGNAATPKTRTVIVEDTQPPTLSLNGSASMTVECHTGFADPGATASDSCAGDLTSSIVVTGSVDADTPGTYTLTYNVSDPSGNAAPSKTRTVTVVDTTSPEITVNGANPMTVECHTGFTDPGATASDSCAGSVPVTVSGTVDADTPGTYTLTYNASDPSGNAATPKTRTVHVVDTQAPTITIIGPNPMTVECHTGFTDPGATASDACAGNVPVVASGFVNPDVPGTYTISYTATDPSGNVAGPVTRTVKVVDTTPPTISCPANITRNADPGTCSAIVTYTVAASDSCSSTVNVVSNPPSGSAFPVGTTTVTAVATDASGNSSSCSFTVTVNNTNPVVTITGPPTGSVYPTNTPVTFSGTYTDNGGGTHTGQWMFDNITVAATVTEPVGSTPGTASATYSFSTPGVYYVKLTITDSCGASGTATQIDGLDAIVVIYDPNGGFVTGGGWINSPAGAYIANPTLTGKANFGFVSKYQKGATIPTGQTEFQFKAGNLNFSSTAYDWLVVAGARAKYKGTGKINGSGNYGFMLTAIDGDVSGGGGTDKFRIKIWNKNNNDAVVYDNQLGAGIDDDPTTTLGGGSIVIHH